MITVGLILLGGGAGALIVNGAAWLDADRAGRRARHRSPARRALVLIGTAGVALGVALTWTALLASTH